jgi:hypothetical protein
MISKIRRTGWMNSAISTAVESLESRRLMTAITAQFSGGNGSASADQYPGIQAGGWSTAWTAPSSSATISSASTFTTNPLNSNGTRFGTTFSATATPGTMAISRGFGATGNINPSSPYQIKFLYRVDGALSSFNSTNDAIFLSGDSSARAGTSPNNTWAVQAFGADPDGTGPAQGMKWAFQNGTRAGGPGSLVNTDVGIVQNNVYEFIIYVDPANRNWSGQVTNLSTAATFSSGVIGFRSSATSSPHVNLGMRVSNSGESNAYSFDAFNITPPPPTAAGTFVATTASKTQINLTWMDNATTEIGYILERSTDSTFTTGVQTFNPAANATSYSDTGLQSGTTYYYRLKATNEGGNSASVTASAVTSVEKVTNLVAAVNGPFQTTVTWTVPNGASTYRIERSANAGTSWDLVSFTLNANGNGFVDQTVNDSTSYLYRVRPRNSAGQLAPDGWTNSNTITTPSGVPTSVAATRVNVGRVDLQWAANGVGTTFVVERSLGGGAWTEVGSTSASSFKDKSIYQSGAYAYRIQGRNAAQLETSTYSSTVNATVEPVTLPFTDNFNRANSSSAGIYWADEAIQINGTDDRNFRIESNEIRPDGQGGFLLLPQQRLLNSSTQARFRSVAFDVYAANNDTPPSQGVVARYANGSYYIASLRKSNISDAYFAQIRRVSGGSSAMLFSREITGITYSNPSTYLKFDVIGTASGDVSLTLYSGQERNGSVDYTMVGTCVDTGTAKLSAQGLTGFYAKEGAVDSKIDDVSISQATAPSSSNAILPYTGTFNQDSPFIGNEWTLRKGSIASTSGLAAGYQQHENEESIATLNGINSSHIHAAADVTVENTHSGVGLVLRYNTANGEHYRAVMSRHHVTHFRIEKVSLVNGQLVSSVLYQADGNPANTAIWGSHANDGANSGKLELEILDGTLRLFFNGQAVLTASDSNELTSGGSVGLYTSRVGSADNLRVDDIASLSVAPRTPENVAAVVQSTTSARVSWGNVLGESGYVVERQDTVGGNWQVVYTASANQTSWDDTGRTSGATYGYRVRAINAAGSSAASAGQSVTVAAPAAITDLTVARASTTELVLSWSNVPNDASQAIQRREGQSGSWSTVTTLPPDAKRYVDKNLDGNTQYQYRVIPINNYGSASPSNVTPPKRPNDSPTVPNFTPEPSGDLITVSVLQGGAELFFEGGANLREGVYRIYYVDGHWSQYTSEYVRGKDPWQWDQYYANELKVATSGFSVVGASGGTLPGENLTFKDYGELTLFGLKNEISSDFDVESETAGKYLEINHPGGPLGVRFNTPFAANTGYSGYVNWQLTASIDLDIDANNDGQIGDAEDSLEDDTGRSGKVVFVNRGDTDFDRIPGYADGYGFDAANDDSDSLSGVQFTPVDLLIPNGDFGQNQVRIRFDYDDANPLTEVTLTNGVYSLAASAGALRLWTQNAGTSRDGRDVAAGGMFIKSGVNYTAAQLGLQLGTARHFWLEAVRVSDGSANLITASVDPDGSGPLGYTAQDIVRNAQVGTRNIRISDNAQVTPSNEAELMHTSPSFSNVQISASNIHFSPDKSKIIGDITISANLDDRYSDFIQGSGGVISSASIFLNGNESPYATPSLAAFKGTGALLTAPYDYSGTLQTTLSGVELDPGWNIIRIAAANGLNHIGFAEGAFEVSPVAPVDEVTSVHIEQHVTAAASKRRVAQGAWTDASLARGSNNNTFSDASLIINFGSTNPFDRSLAQTTFNANLTDVALSLTRPVTFTRDANLKLTGSVEMDPTNAPGVMTDVELTIGSYDVWLDSDLNGSASTHLLLNRTTNQSIYRFENGAYVLDAGSTDPFAVSPSGFVSVAVTSPNVNVSSANFNFTNSPDGSLFAVSVYEEYEREDYTDYSVNASAAVASVTISHPGTQSVFTTEVYSSAPISQVAAAAAFGTGGPQRQIVSVNGTLVLSQTNSANPELLLANPKNGTPQSNPTPPSSPRENTFVAGLSEGLVAPFTQFSDTVGNLVQWVKNELNDGVSFIDKVMFYLSELINNGENIVEAGVEGVRVVSTSAAILAPVLATIAANPTGEEADQFIAGSHPVYAQLPGQVRQAVELGAELIQKFLNSSNYDSGWYVGYVISTIAMEVGIGAVVGGSLTLMAKSGMLDRVLPRLQGYGGVFASKADEMASFVSDLATTRMCFVAGTLVHTSTGLRPIEQIRDGDLVLSRDQKTGAQTWKQVVDTITTRPSELYHLRYGIDMDGNGTLDRYDNLSTTAAHPFYVQGQNAFVAAGNLKLGDDFRLANGQTAELVDIDVEAAAAGSTFTTYNFEVADFHTYFVGEDGVWVHNQGRVICDDLAAFWRRLSSSGVSDDIALNRMSQYLVAKYAPGTANVFAREMGDAVEDIVRRRRLDIGKSVPAAHIWSPGTNGNSGVNLWKKHWIKHKDEFPEFNSAINYVDHALDFSNIRASSGSIKVVEGMYNNRLQRVVWNRADSNKISIATIDPNTGDVINVSTLFRFDRDYLESHDNLVDAPNGPDVFEQAFTLVYSDAQRPWSNVVFK